MKNRTDTFEFDGRTFEIITTMEAGFKGEMAAAHIYEVVRPNWKIFRTRWLDTKNFWIDTFPTIEEGVKQMLCRVLAREDEFNGAQRKWDEFFNK